MQNIGLYENIPSLENNFAIKFRKYESDSALVAHWHEHVELIYLLDGECTFFCDGEAENAVSGDLLVLNSAEIHSFDVKRHLVFYSVLLYPSFFKDTDYGKTKLANVIKADDHIKDIFEKMYLEYTSNEKMNDIMLMGHTYMLIGYLARRYSVKKRDRSNRKDFERGLMRLNLVMEYISEHYTERITTRELSRLCYLSEEHFCRFFKETVGKSATDYINLYRIDKSCVLLANTNDSITDIGSAVGYEDISYFSRVFKNKKGVSPAMYRRTVREKKRARIKP